MTHTRPSIVHVVAPVGFGGGEALLSATVGHPEAEFLEAVVSAGRSAELEAALESRGIVIRSLGRQVGQQRHGKWGTLARSPLLIGRLARTIREMSPTVVHCHGFPPAVVGPLVGRAVGKVYTHHYERQPPGRVEKLALASVYRRYHLLTAPTAHLANVLNEHFELDSPHFVKVPNLVDDRFFTATGEDDAGWRKRFPGKLIGICAGRLIQSKNVDGLVRAVAQLQPEEAGALVILVVGSGPAEAHVRRLSSELDVAGSIHFTGQMAHRDMAAAYRSADFGVFPSTSEGFGLAAAECIAAGRPVLALNTPVMREVIGPAGVLVEEDGLAQGLRQMISHQAPAVTVVRSVAEQYRSARVRREWERIYGRAREMATVKR